MAAYGPLCTEFYDLDKPAAPTDSIAFYTSNASQSGGPVLEPMCGSGRFLVPMLAAGIRVDGVDTSGSMLAMCRQRAAALGLQPTLYEQPIECMSLPSTYAMAFIPAGSIGLLRTREELEASMFSLRRHLRNKAWLFIELFSPKSGEVTPIQSVRRVVQCANGPTITYEASIDHCASSKSFSIHGVYERRRDLEVIESEHEELVVRTHHLTEIVALLGHCGFGDTHVCDSSDKDWLSRSDCALIRARA